MKLYGRGKRAAKPIGDREQGRVDPADECRPVRELKRDVKELWKGAAEDEGRAAGKRNLSCRRLRAE